MPIAFASRKHIAALVLFYQNNQKPIYLADFISVVWANTLGRGNERSMRDGYGDANITYSFASFSTEEIEAAPVVTPVNCLKQCQFLEFQSCESKGYYNSHAWETLHRITHCAIASLPEYDDYPWGLDE